METLPKQHPHKETKVLPTKESIFVKINSIRLTLDEYSVIKMQINTIFQNYSKRPYFTAYLNSFNTEINKLHNSMFYRSTSEEENTKINAELNKIIQTFRINLVKQETFF